MDPDLLFLGTEFGLWISNDGGQRWAQYKGRDFPAVAVRDIVVHPRTSDLILATHGRGIWIIDDVSPLRALTPQVICGRRGIPAIAERRAVDGDFGGWSEGDNSFSGQNRPTEA